MLKNILKYSVISALVIISGCATTVKVKLLKSPEFNLGSRRKIAILNFDLNGTMNDFYNRNYGLSYFSGSRISDEITQRLLANKHFTVIERQELAKIIGEQGLAGSGFVDTSNAVKLGKLFGVEAILMGSGSYSVEESIYRENESKDYPDKVISYEKVTLYRNTNLKLSYRIVDTQTGEIIASSSLADPNTINSYYGFPLRGSEKTEYKSQNPSTIYNNPFNTTSASPGGLNDQLNFYSIEEKATELQSWNNSIDGSIEKLADKIVKQIAPYYVEEDREIKDGNTANMKEALQLAKSGNWENAKYLWEAIIKDTSKEAVSDYVNAMYNLATYYELSSDLDKASFYFQQAYNYSNNPAYLSEKSRVEKRKQEIEILKSQGRDKDVDVKVNNRIPANQQTDMINHAQLGAKFYSSGNISEAISEYEKALLANPNDAGLHSNIAIIYYSQAKFDEAIKHYNASIMLNPSDQNNYYNLGLSYQSLGKINEAKIQYGKSCQLGFKSACDILLKLN